MSHKTESSPSDNPSFSAKVLICNKKGLHARAAALFVKCVEQYDADASVTRDSETASGSSILDLLMLAAGKGTNIVISTSGNQAKQALEALVELVEARFHEDE